LKLEPGLKQALENQVRRDAVKLEPGLKQELENQVRQVQP
jgi:hypothetical protein